MPVKKTREFSPVSVLLLSDKNALSK